MSKFAQLPRYRRPIGSALAKRLLEPRRFIQVVAGPRQVGKTTLIRQVQVELSPSWHYASADEPTLRGRAWLEEQWQTARLVSGADPILVLDEVQKIVGWSEVVKRLWDEDTAAGRPLKVVLLGSAPLLIQQGLTESLAGRFEVIHVTHWSYPEMRDAFGCRSTCSTAGIPGPHRSSTTRSDGRATSWMRSSNQRFPGTFS
jgi:uncharacterized protein